MMMLMMLTAFMGFALQSCGSDDDNKSEATDTYTMSLEIVDKGELSDAEVEYLNNRIAKKLAESGAPTTVTATETQAKAALDLAITMHKSTFEEEFKGNTLKFTLAFILRNSSKKVVYQRNVLVDGENVIVQ